MNSKIANALFGYIETLYDMNQKLIVLCGVDAFVDFENGQKEILEILQDIPRIIPFSFDIKTKKLCIQKRDGLLEYEEDIKYLRNEYENILTDNYEFLNNVRKIRNKYEHKMHGIKLLASVCGSGSLFQYRFDVEVEGEIVELTISAIECINLVKKVNILFSQIVSDIIQFAYDNKEANRYIGRLERFDFKDFNKIYESSLIREIGKLMRTF